MSLGIKSEYTKMTTNHDSMSSSYANTSQDGASATETTMTTVETSFLDSEKGRLSARVHHQPDLLLRSQESEEKEIEKSSEDLLSKSVSEPENKK